MDLEEVWRQPVKTPPITYEATDHQKNENWSVSIYKYAMAKAYTEESITLIISTLWSSTWWSSIHLFAKYDVITLQNYSIAIRSPMWVIVKPLANAYIG